MDNHRILVDNEKSSNLGLTEDAEDSKQMCFYQQDDPENMCSNCESGALRGNCRIMSKIRTYESD